jgi:hypothetical protein
MKRTLLFLLLLPLALAADETVRLQLSGRVNWTPPAATEIGEGFEETGAPSGWGSSGTVDWDKTESPLVGSQSLWINTVSSTATNGSAYADASVAYAKVRISMTNLPSNTTTLLSIKNSSDTTLAGLRVASSGAISLFANGTASANSTGTISVNTEYDLWLAFVSGGTCYAAFAPAGDARPTSGNNYRSKTGEAGEAVTYFLGSSGAGTVAGVRFDSAEWSESQLD